MKRFLSALIYICILLVVFTKTVSAQTPSISNSPDQTTSPAVSTAPGKPANHVQYPLNVNSDVPQDFHTYTQSVVLELLSAFSCQLSGIDPLNPNGQCLGADPATGKLGFVQNKGGAIGFLTDSINMTYQIPVSSGQYIAVLYDNFGIAKKTYAQERGMGFNSLIPILGLWQQIRNIVYVLFVLIFAVVGIGIMFRLKIDPRSVMTIQNSLPKIVVGLILITFSYAIAGFLVDTMYVTLYLTHDVVKRAAPGTGIEQLTPQFIQGSNPFGAVGKAAGGLPDIVSKASGGVVKVIKSAAGMEKGAPESELAGTVTGVYSDIKKDGFFSKVFGGALEAMPYFGNNHTLIDIVIDSASLIAGLSGAFKVLGLPAAEAGTFSLGSIQNIPFAIGAFALIVPIAEFTLREILPNLIAFFIILGILITALARLWFALFKAYLYILLFIIISPFFIAFGLVPGEHTSVGFKPWIRGLIANLSAFPVTYALILFAMLFIEKIKATEGGFVPPLIGSQNTSAFGSLFAIGIILAIPEILNMVKGALKAPEGKLGAAVSGGVGMGVGLTKSLAAPATKRLIAHKDPFTGNLEAGYLTRKARSMIFSSAEGVFNSSPKAKTLGGTIAKSRVGQWLGRQAKEATSTPKQFKENERIRLSQEAEEQKAKNTREADVYTMALNGNLENHRNEAVEKAASISGKTKPQIELMKKTGKLQSFVEDLAENAPEGSPPKNSAIAAVERLRQIKNDLFENAKRVNPSATPEMSNEQLTNIIRTAHGAQPLEPVKPTKDRLYEEADRLIEDIINRGSEALEKVSKEDLQRLAQAHNVPIDDTMDKESIINIIAERGNRRATEETGNTST